MAQSLSRILLHVIFSTKDRCEFFKDLNIRKETHSFLAGTLKKRGAIPILIGGVSDHIHILCLQSNDELMKKTIGEAKRSSSIWIKSKDETLSDFKWQRGYGVFSVSESNLESVRKYILKQENHHKKVTFKEEFRLFLQKHNIEFDEKYIWD